MLKLKVLSVGKTKEEWLDLAIKEYTKRLSPVVAVEFLYAKTDEQLLSLAEQEPVAICLDAAGQKMTSEAFASFAMHKFEEGGSRLSFIIGGPEGLPDRLKRERPLLSLSPLTMTHQIVRLVLIEQIYRAFEIRKGSPYHK